MASINRKMFGWLILPPLLLCQGCETESTQTPDNPPSYLGRDQSNPPPITLTGLNPSPIAVDQQPQFQSGTLAESPVITPQAAMLVAQARAALQQQAAHNSLLPSKSAVEIFLADLSGLALSTSYIFSFLRYPSVRRCTGKLLTFALLNLGKAALFAFWVVCAVLNVLIFGLRLVLSVPIPSWAPPEFF